MALLIFILGFVGLGGFVAVLKALFGRPKLEFEFYVVDRPGVGQSLTCSLVNSPFRNLMMKALFVPRPHIDDISVRCEVVNRMESPKDVVRAFWATMVTQDKERGRQLSLPASIHPVGFSILTYVDSNKAAWTQDAQVGSTSLMNDTLYVIAATAYLGDKRVKSHLVGCIIKNRIVFVQPLPESVMWSK